MSKGKAMYKMNKSQMKKVFPMLEILSTLPSDELQLVLPFLNHSVCLGLLECVDHGVCNKSIPLEIRSELREKLIKHKKKFRYLVNKEEYRAENAAEREKVLEKKKKTLVHVADCLNDIFKVAIPALTEYVSERKKDKE